MVLINELTVEQINAALLHLQRSKDEVVGGNKGTIIQNISVNNSGGGNNVDYFGTIKLLARNIETNKDAIDKNTSDIASLKDDMKDIEKSVEETLQGLADNGISDLSFDPLTKQLTITTNDGDTFQTVITQDIGVLSYDSVNNKLVLTTGEQSQEITLPYIKISEKGSANGVATLDSSGRVPYSQLPESAMEFLGQWDASTNTPHLADGTGTNGDFYVCNVGGTVIFGTGNTQTFVPNDRVIYNGSSSQWIKLPAGQVSSVNGMSGDVTLTASDIDYSTGVTIKDKIDANAVQANWNEADNTSLAFIKNKPSLATVATSGSYTDLDNKPTIPAAQVQSNWTETNSSSKAFIKNKPTLATVATSGSYNDLSNKPTIPAAQIQSDWTQTDSTKKDFIKNKIPIWITNGSADDNMSPVNVVEAGNTRPVTSGGVASALNDYDKATEWTDTLISICPTVGAGQEKTYTINSTTISDLPVQIRGIVTTRVNSLNNRIIQLYYCNQSNNNNIYYRYIEWNESAWIVGVSWVKLTTTADVDSFVYTTLYGALSQSTGTVTPTVDYTPLTQEVTVNFPTTKIYKIFSTFLYKITNTPSTSYQLTLHIKIDDTVYQVGSMATVYDYIAFTGFTTATITKGIHSISIGCRVAHNSKVVNFNVPYYNLMSFFAI